MTPVQPGQAFQWKTGRTDYEMPWDGQDRHFIVYLPAQYDHTKATPVVFMFHGTTAGSGMFQELPVMQHAPIPVY